MGSSDNPCPHPIVGIKKRTMMTWDIYIYGIVWFYINHINHISPLARSWALKMFWMIPMANPCAHPQYGSYISKFLGKNVQFLWGEFMVYSWYQFRWFSPWPCLNQLGFLSGDWLHHYLTGEKPWETQGFGWSNHVICRKPWVSGCFGWIIHLNQSWKDLKISFDIDSNWTSCSWCFHAEFGWVWVRTLFSSPKDHRSSHVASYNFVTHNYQSLKATTQDHWHELAWIGMNWNVFLGQNLVALWFTLVRARNAK